MGTGTCSTTMCFRPIRWSGMGVEFAERLREGIFLTAMGSTDFDRRWIGGSGKGGTFESGGPSWGRRRFWFSYSSPIWFSPYGQEKFMYPCLPDRGWKSNEKKEKIVREVFCKSRKNLSMQYFWQRDTNLTQTRNRKIDRKTPTHLKSYLLFPDASLFL